MDDPIEEVSDELLDAEAPPLSPREEDAAHREAFLLSIPDPKFQWIEAKKCKLTELNPADTSTPSVVDRYATFLAPALLHGWSVAPAGRLFEIIDGRHRYLALKQRKELHRKVGCFIFENLTREQKATLFAYHNWWRRFVSQNERYLGLLAAGNPTVIRVERVQEELGLRVGALAAMRQVVDSGKNLNEGEMALRFSLSTLDLVYRGDDTRFNQLLVKGLGRFWVKYHAHPNFDISDFPERLLRTDMTARQVVNRAVAERKSTGEAAASWVFRWFVARHDAGRRKRLVPKKTRSYGSGASGPMLEEFDVD